MGRKWVMQNGKVRKIGLVTVWLGWLVYWLKELSFLFFRGRGGGVLIDWTKPFQIYSIVPGHCSSEVVENQRDFHSTRYPWYLRRYRTRRVLEEMLHETVGQGRTEGKYDPNLPKKTTTRRDEILPSAPSTVCFVLSSLGINSRCFRRFPASCSNRGVVSLYYV